MNKNKGKNVEGKVEGSENDEGTLTLTQEELDLMLQKESDKRVSSALETARTKWESEVGGKIDSHLKDYEKRAQMTPEELKTMDLEAKFKALEEKEQEYEVMTKKMAINDMLSSKGLSTVLTDFVYDNDTEVVEQNIATLEQLVMGMVNEEVEKRIGNTKPGANINTDGLDKETFKRLSIVERSELFSKDPELFKQLSK